MNKVTVKIETEKIFFENLKFFSEFVMKNCKLLENDDFLSENFGNLRYFYSDILPLENQLLSLTSKTEFKDRIRFYHNSKLQLPIIFLVNLFVESVIETNNNFCIHVLNYDKTKLEERWFFNLLNAKIRNIKEIILVIQDTKLLTQFGFENQKNSLYCQEESFFDSYDSDELRSLFQEAMTLGFHEDAIKLGNSYMLKNQDDLEFKMYLGLSYVNADIPFIGEKIYLEILEEATSAKILAETCYSIAMLYIRHHHKEHLNLELGENYLDKGKEIILNSKEELGKDYLYEYIFNRNGRALLHFKGEGLQRSHDWTDDGQWSMFLNYGKDHLLHRTVLLFNCTLTSEALGNYDDSLLYYYTLLSLDPYYPDYWYRKAIFHNKQEQLEKAIEAIDRTIYLNRYNDSYYAHKSDIVLNTDVEQATQLLWKAVDLNPLSEEHYINLSAILLDMNKNNEVISLLESVREYKNHAINNNLAMAYSNLSNNEEAISILKDVVNFDKTGEVSSNLSAFYYEIGEYSLALDYIENALSIAGDNPDIQENKAFLIEKMTN